MTISFKRVSEVALQYCIFGKLPRRGDFVRVNASHPVAQEFDQMIARSLSLAAQQEDWQSLYRKAGPVDFHFTSSDNRWTFFGVLCPSEDESGRCFPLVAGAILPSEAISPFLPELAIANELFFSGLRDQLLSALDNSVEMVACRQFLEAQQLPNARVDADIDLATNVLSRHLHQTSVVQINQQLQSAGYSGVNSFLLAFVFYGKLLQRYGAAMPKQVFLLPLPSAPGEDVLGVATWLSLYRAATRLISGRFPHVLIMQQQGKRVLALAPECFPDRFLAMPWGLPPEANTILDVEDEKAPWSTHSSFADVSYILDRRLDDADLDVFTLQNIIEKLIKTLA